MGFLLTASSTVMCSHGGSATPTVVFPRVMVQGSPVVQMSSVYTIAGCAFPPPPAANGPCVTGQFIVGTTRVMAGGQPLLVQSSSGICVPTGTPTSIVVTQMKVQAL